MTRPSPSPVADTARPQRPEGQRRRGRKRRWLLGLFTLLLALLYWQRFAVLRWTLESTMAHVLGAQVSLGSLTLDDDDWRLRDLRIEQPRIEPRLAVAHLPEVTVTLPWRPFREAARVESVEVHGGKLILQRAAALPDNDDPLPNIGSLEVHGLALHWGRSTPENAAPSGAPLYVDADLRDIAGPLRGGLELRSEHLDLASLDEFLSPPGTASTGPRVIGTLPDFALRLTWTDLGPALQVEAAGSDLTLEAPDAHLTTQGWRVSYTPDTHQVLVTSPGLRLTTDRGTLQGEGFEVSGRGSNPFTGASAEPTDPPAGNDGLRGSLHLDRISWQPEGALWQEDELTVDWQATKSRDDDWSLQAATTTSRWFDGARLNARLGVDGDLQEVNGDVQGWRWRLPDGALATLDSQFQLRGENLAARVSLHDLDRPSRRQGLQLTAQHLPLEVRFDGRLPSPTTAATTGPTTGPMTDATMTDATMTDDHPGGAPLRLDGRLDIDIGGRLEATATGAWQLRGASPSWDLQLTTGALTLASVQSFFETPWVPAAWQAEARFRVSGPFSGTLDAPRAQLTVDVQGAKVTAPPRDGAPPRRLDLEATSFRVVLGDALSLPKLHWQGTVHGLGDTPGRIEVASNVQLDTSGAPRDVTLESLDVHFPALGSVHLNGKWQRTAAAPESASAASRPATRLENMPGTLRARIDFDDIDLERLRPYWPSRIGDVLSTSTLQGRLDGSWQLTSPGLAPASTAASDAATPDAAPDAAPENAWHLSGPMSLDGLGYASQDGSRVLEGLRLEATTHAQWSAAGPWQARLDGTTSGFLLLWDTFFGDFEGWQSVLRMSVEGTASATPGEAVDLTFWDAELQLPEGFLATVRGYPAAPEPSAATTAATTAATSAATSATLTKTPAWHIEGVLRSDDLAAAHRRYLAPTFGPLVGDAVQGQLDLQTSGRWSAEGLSSRGRLALRDVSWTALANTSVAGLRLDVPFDLGPDDWTGTPGRRPTARPAARQRGSLRFDELSAGGLRLPATTANLWTEGLALGLEDQLAIPMYGGRWVLQALQLSGLSSAERRLRTAVEMQRLDLAELSRDLGIPPLEGTLEGRLERVEIAGQQLTVDGGGRLSLFGGHIDIDGISGSEIFSPFPRLVLSARLQGIDLGRLTGRFDVGKMHGTLQGSIEDCALFRGIPVTCRARFETVDRPGVRRSVDVKAVNNLTILGTGARTNVFDRGIQRLFNRFTYSRFAVDIDLANDSLLLQGLETRGNKELFMSGRLPFPIDIINAQPGRRVSFQAMLKRLESLDFEAATVSSGNP